MAIRKRVYSKLHDRIGRVLIIIRDILRLFYLSLNLVRFLRIIPLILAISMSILIKVIGLVSGGWTGFLFWMLVVVLLEIVR